MSTADDLAAKAIASAESSAAKAINDPAWVSRGVAAVRKQADELGPLAPAGAAGLDYLDAHRDAIATVAGGTFAGVVHQLALGRDDAAEQLFLDELESKATPEGRTRARLDSARDVVLEEDDARARWAETKTLVLGFLKVAAEAAGPILVEVLKGSLAGMAQRRS